MTRPTQLISGDPAPSTWLDHYDATGAALFEYDYPACTDVNTAGILTFTPVAADVGTRTFTFVAQNEHGATTNDFVVEVLPAPLTPAELFAEWLTARQLSPESYPADADSDNDGVSNWKEFLADTDPSDRDSLFTISLAPSSSATNVVWTFTASTSRYYNLVTSSNLLDFDTNFLGRGTANMSFTNNSLLETLFSRLQALLAPPDSPE